ncbi:histidine transporter [Moraxella caviae]|uniref:Histidine transporter n=1 Tax=Moraxella caviae TaxID=34060 RepID=A0A1T0A878_9GAMM|nr:YjiH family protein [Moraxella caviae]OOR91907.1 histidine transporter [Moraxella caviae]STZ09761.1 Uncharacterized protein conserved in bacteria [Moraxella caviae]
MTEKPTPISKTRAIIQLVLFSAIGIVAFFVPFTIGGKSTILFDHMASYLVNEQRTLSITLLFAMMIYGVAKPIMSGEFKKSLTDLILTVFKAIGLILAVLYVTNTAPDVIMQKDMLPFLFDKLALTVGMIVPIGSLILASLVGFGLLEMIGVLMQPVMRPLFKTPGSSAIDAVASFVGSYSIGLLITNRVYLQGQYSAKEAMIIATGFSTVSAAFMVIVAKTLDIMDHWNLFFWSSLVITFLVTAITARLPPIRTADDTHQRQEIDSIKGKRLTTALNVGISTSQNAGSVWQIFWSNFRDGIQMTAAIIPSILAIGLAGLLLAKYTPIFDVLGLLLYPFAYIVGLPEPMMATKGMAAGLAEMFLPALLLGDMPILVRFVAAVVSISSVLFFSGMIPCVLATRLPISITQMLIIWFERTVLSLMLATLVGHAAISAGLL